MKSICGVLHIVSSTNTMFSFKCFSYSFFVCTFMIYYILWGTLSMAYHEKKKALFIWMEFLFLLLLIIIYHHHHHYYYYYYHYYCYYNKTRRQRIFNLFRDYCHKFKSCFNLSIFMCPMTCWPKYFDCSGLFLIDRYLCLSVILCINLTQFWNMTRLGVLLICWTMLVITWIIFCWQ